MFSMDVPLEAVADQLGHASMGVTKGVYVHLLPGSRAKAAKAMEELLCKDFVPVTSPRPRPAARPLARHRRANDNKEPLIRTSVGRPGLDPGTLGFEPGRAGASVVVRVAWSADYVCPPTSVEILSNLLPWLHDWLHSFGSGVSSVVQVSDNDEVRIEVRVEMFDR